MAKYINADELRKNIEVDKYGNISTTINEFRIAVELSVADVVEVVRCKDCKYRTEHAGADFWLCRQHGVLFKPDDYCSYGKRRESDGGA